MAVTYSAVFMPHVEAALTSAGFKTLHLQWDLPEGLYPVKGDLFADARLGGYQFTVVDRIIAFDENHDMTFQLLLDFAATAAIVPFTGAPGSGPTLHIVGQR